MAYGVEDPMTNELCHDCKQVPGTHTYFLGNKRCNLCAMMFDAQNYAKRRAEWQAEREALNSHVDRSRAEGECPDDGVTCESCCQCSEFDHGICLDCGADRTDDLVAAAEAACEGDR